MNKRFTLFLLGVLICASSALAVLPTKGFYQITNSKYSFYMTENYSANTLECSALSVSNPYAQYWEVIPTITGYQLRNAYTGNYVMVQNSTSQTFRTGSTVSEVTITENDLDDGFNLIKCGGYMHCDASYKVVNWSDTKNTANHWKFTAVGVSEEDVAKARQEYQEVEVLKAKASTYSTMMMNYFTDYACTQLNDACKAKTDDQMVEMMTADGLPTKLQDIVLKVKNGWWTNTEKSTFADNNKYAEEFRVQEYNPYSDASKWRDQKVMTYSLSYMGNPTGIYANAKDVIYLFVDQDTPADATLYACGVVGNERIQSSTAGTQLKKGLNILVTGSDKTIYYINYVVNTVDLKKKIADFPNIKIHIEGGFAQGYYKKPAKNSQAEDEKYVYLRNNAKDNTIFLVKGDHTLFSYDKGAYTYSSEWRYSIFNSIDWYDKVEDWEHALMGFKDEVAEGKYTGIPANANCPINLDGGKAWYPTYCNNPIMSLQGSSDSNPFATYYYISMPGYGGIESSFNADRADFDTWCVGHEHGHQNQLVINLESSTESSNNLFSNLVTYMTGYRMSRGGKFDENWDYFQNHIVFGKRDIGMTHRMYWNLYLYYHLAGKDKTFYPRFFQKLRESRLILGDATQSWLKFYKIACETAGEDLTEYFRLWGFFEPCDKVNFGDYTSYVVTVTQAQIDAAIKEVKDKGYKENRQILFIEDRIKPLLRTDIHASKAEGDKKYKPNNSGTYIWTTQADGTVTNTKDVYGDVGQFSDYMDENIVAGNYVYTASGTTLSLDGEGGVGFIVYDKDGNIARLANSKTFTIDGQLAIDGFTVKVVNADGTETEVQDAGESGTPEQKLAALKSAIEAANEYIKLEDETDKKVGYYRSSDLATLNDLVDQAEAAIEKESVEDYSSISSKISKELLRIELEVGTIEMEPGSYYSIVNSAYKRYMQIDNVNLILATNTGTTVTTSRMFAFVPSNKEGYYYMQCKNSGLYVKTLSTSVTSTITAASDTTGCEKFRLTSNGDGTFGIQASDGASNHFMHSAQNASYNVVGWSADASASKWYVTLVEEHSVADMEEQLAELIEKTQNLASCVADYKTPQTITLQTTDPEAPGYLSCNYPGSTNIANLLDGNTKTYFRTNSLEVANEFHSLLVDLGEGNSVSVIRYGYSTRAAAGDKPTWIAVQGSNDGVSFSQLKNSKSTDTNNPLIDNSGTTSESWESATMTLSTTKSYRYLRFVVKNTNTQNSYNNTGKYYFQISEFSLFDADRHIEIHEGVEGVQTSDINTALNAVDKAKAYLEGGNKSPYDMLQQINDMQKAYDNLDSVIPTAIEDVIADSANAAVYDPSKPAYDLSGRLIKNPAKGIYIQNGVKVLVR